MRTLSCQQKHDVISEVAERMQALAREGVATERACLYSAAFAAIAVARRGERAILQAGSASWPFKAPERDDGTGPTHFGYEFDLRDPLSAACLMNGILPEIHCWAAIPASGELIDLTTGHQPTLMRVVLPGEEWSDAPLPGHFWGKAGALPERWRYAPNAQAIQVALDFLRHGRPDVYREMHQRALVAM
jgi:hypothetical protein